MRIAVINESFPVYNLATDKIATKFRREGHEVFYSPRADMWSFMCDKAYLSALFTYDLDKKNGKGMVPDIRQLLDSGVEVEVGGPAVTAMPQYIESQTGVIPHMGLDDRFEHVPGKYKATFTSRGCPRACDFCIVSKVEGRKMIEYDTFSIPEGRNPFVGDNNILATSWGHQKLVVQKLKHVKNLDINSGFDDRIFIKDPERYWQLYNELDMEAWRFAYDSPEQKEAIQACAEFLHTKGVDYRHIIVFCLIGFGDSTFDEGLERLKFLIEIGTSPYPMRYRPLDSLIKNYTPPGWDPGQLEKLFNWAGVPWHWKSTSWEDFVWPIKKKK